MNTWSGPHSVEIFGHTVVVPASDEEYRWAHTADQAAEDQESLRQKWYRVLGIGVQEAVKVDGFEDTFRNALAEVRASAIARQEAATEYERRVGELHALFNLLAGGGSISISPAAGQTLIVEANGRQSEGNRYREMDDRGVFVARSVTCNSQQWQVHLWDSAEPGLIGANMVTINIDDRPTEFRVVGVDLPPQP